MRFTAPLFASVLSALMLLGAFTVSAGASNTAQIKRGGTLTIGYIGLSWKSLDPDQTSSVQVQTTFSPEFQGLFTFTPAGTLEPELATGYTYSANRLAVTITLRHGVTFQDGTAFNSAAVLYNLERMASPTVGSECVPDFSLVSSVSADGPYKVIVHFSSPYGALAQILGGLACTLISSPTAVQTEGANYGANPVGTGPYKYQSEVVNSTLDFTKSPGYWDKATAGYYSNVDMVNLPTDQACIEAVEAGTIQVCGGGDVNDAVSVRGVKSIKTIDAPADTVADVRVLVSKPPFNNIYARKALAQAIDVGSITKNLYHNLVTPTESYEVPTCWCFDGNRVKGYPQYTTSLATADVQKAGGLTFTMLVSAVPDEEQLAAAIQAQLQAVGINVTLDPVSQTVEDTDFHALDYQAALTSAYDDPDPDTLYYRQFNSTSTNDQAGLDDPVIDSLTTEARETVAQPQRKRLYEQVQERLDEVDLPFIPLFATPQYYFVSKHLRGFNVIEAGYITVWSTYMS